MVSSVDIRSWFEQIYYRVIYTVLLVYLFQDADSGDFLKQCLCHTLYRNGVQRHCFGIAFIILL